MSRFLWFTVYKSTFTLHYITSWNIRPGNNRITASSQAPKLS